MAESEERYVLSTQYGGTGGGHWDDGLYHGLTEITIHSGAWIDSIAVVYHRNGERIQGAKHGGNGGSPKTITFGPDEVLKTVSGSVGEDDSVLLMESLKFETNIRAYGPFGAEGGKKFTLTVKDGDKIIGFFGRSGGEGLDAIGFHVETHPTHP